VTGGMVGAERLLAACKRQPVDTTPIWFMRQAGRCFPQYRALREKYDIITLAKTPELSAEVSLMPVEHLGVDGAVLFADIMLPLEAMGVEYLIEPEIGPIIGNPIRSREAVESLRIVDGKEATPYVLEVIRILRRELSDGRSAVIGFSGSPFTLACYMVEGRPSRDYAAAKAMMLGEPDLWNALMSKVTQTVIGYLRDQVEAGAQAVQLFDSWVGILSVNQYRHLVQPHVATVFRGLSDLDVPKIHFGTGNAHLLEDMVEAGGDVISLDWRLPLDAAWKRIGYDRGVQGNLDPAVLMAPWDRIRDDAMDVLRRAEGRPGHIFNLGHGVLPDTVPATLAKLVETVHSAEGASVK
jgi:uroporphyrinogen decarboxylase